MISRYSVAVDDGYFTVGTGKTLDMWFMVTVVYHGLNRGLAVYHNITKIGESSTHDKNYSYSPGPGTFTLNRKYTNQDNYYSSVMFDELTMWNRALSSQEVEKIYKTY